MELVPNEQAKPALPKTGGRCLKCDAIVAREAAYPKVPANGDGATPLMHVVDGAECGPVAKALLYHVVGRIGPNDIVSVQPTLQTPEENYVGVLSMWRDAIEADIQIRDQRGAVVIGQARPRLVILDWKPVGVQL